MDFPEYTNKTAKPHVIQTTILVCRNSCSLASIKKGKRGEIKDDDDEEIGREGGDRDGVDARDRICDRREVGA